MTYFDDLDGALEEAEYCANMDEEPQAIVASGSGFKVMPRKAARASGLYILETVNPVEVFL